MKQKPVIAVSIGDPTGIGPEVTLKALQDDSLRESAYWILAGDSAAFTFIRTDNLKTLAHLTNVRITDSGAIGLPLAMGRISESGGRSAVAYIREAVSLCQSGAAHAMVTGPVNKEAIRLSDTSFTGHTDYIAALCGVSGARMLLINDLMRVLHVTTHCSLRLACDSDSERVLSTLEIGHAALSQLGLVRRKIAVCGLNPHAGEHGAFGDEDERVIVPAIRRARESGIDCVGPLPADTVFLHAKKGQYDLVIAMYHDQGHIPMKLLDFEHTVNVSLGLPLIRTSVDHGTAFEIAGKNQASSTNMKSAMRLAIQMALNHKTRA